MEQQEQLRWIPPLVLFIVISTVIFRDIPLPDMSTVPLSSKCGLCNKGKIYSYWLFFSKTLHKCIAWLALESTARTVLSRQSTLPTELMIIPVQLLSKQGSKLLTTRQTQTLCYIMAQQPTTTHTHKLTYHCSCRQDQSADNDTDMPQSVKTSPFASLVNDRSPKFKLVSKALDMQREKKRR